LVIFATGRDRIGMQRCHEEIIVSHIFSLYLFWLAFRSNGKNAQKAYVNLAQYILNLGTQFKKCLLIENEFFKNLLFGG
jgi:hypothetical protein